MDEIEKRLRETSEHCFNCYEAWQKSKKDTAARETLIEAIHEIRKVASRIEIELAISERDEAVKKPIPIPPHRDAQRRNHDDENDNRGNTDAPQSSGGPPKSRGARKRRPPSKSKSDD